MSNEVIQLNQFKLSQEELDKVVNQYHFPYKKTKVFNSLKENILISGATGFLAIHLICYLMLDTRVKNIYAVVRNKEKFLLNLETFGIIQNNEFSSSFLATLTHTHQQFIETTNFNILYNKKIHFLIGDVSKANWQLNFNEMIHPIDVVIHCA